MEQYKWECVQVLGGYHDRTIFSVAWGEGAPGSLGWIASASSDGQIIVYQVEVSSQIALSDVTRTDLNRGQGTREGGTEARVLTKAASAHGVHDVNCVGWCPRKGLEDHLASCGDDGSVKIWKVLVAK